MKDITDINHKIKIVSSQIHNLHKEREKIISHALSLQEGDPVRHELEERLETQADVYQELREELDNLLFQKKHAQ